jgi:hypothetical protein
MAQHWRERRIVEPNDEYRAILSSLALRLHECVKECLLLLIGPRLTHICLREKHNGQLAFINRSIEPCNDALAVIYLHVVDPHVNPKSPKFCDV